MRMKWLVSLLTVFSLVLGASVAKEASVTFSNGVYTVKDSWDTQAAAWARFEDSLFDIGWGKLWIHTNKDQADLIQMHAAGYLEGYLLADHIYNHKSNVFTYEAQHYLNRSDFSPEIYSFVEDTRLHLEHQVATQSDPFWTNVGLIYAQLEGLTEGYNKANTAHPMDLATMYMFQSIGDLLDLYSFNLTKGMSSIELTDFWAERNRCTGLVRLLDGNSELYVSQAAWFFFGSLNKVMKYYDFALQTPSVASPRISMSSYPGLLYSFDDFYVLSSGLSVIETTFGILNTTLFANPLHPTVLLEWVRVMIANRMAHNGSEWVSVFGHENSGTYNNQYLVVDYKLFEPNAKSLTPGLFWVLEQYPGGVNSKDMTALLEKQRYFGSYNVPYLDETYEICNYTAAAAVDAHATFWDDRYKCCRAQIFARDAPNVTCLADMQQIMRQNNYKKDPFSFDPLFQAADPGAALASRYDLRTAPLAKPNAFGELDSKITSSGMAAHMTFTAIAGPIHSDDPAAGLPSFTWATSPVVVPHAGLPESFDFDWVLFHPEDPAVPTVMIVCLVLAGLVSVALALYAIILGVRKYRASRSAAYTALPDGVTPSIQSP